MYFVNRLKNWNSWGIKEEIHVKENGTIRPILLPFTLTQGGVEIQGKTSMPT